VFGCAGAAGVDVPLAGVLDGDAGTLASTGLAPLVPALAAALMFIVFTVVAALGGIALDELLSALHAQRLRAAIQRHNDDCVPLLDILIISVLQCVGRSRPDPTSSLRAPPFGALSC
jgi:hypothetical protein